MDQCTWSGHGKHFDEAYHEPRICNGVGQAHIKPTTQEKGALSPAKDESSQERRCHVWPDMCESHLTRTATLIFVKAPRQPFKAFDTFSMAVVADSGSRSTVGGDAKRDQSRFTSKTGMIRSVDAS